MIIIYSPTIGFKPILVDTHHAPLLKEALWIDLFSPTKEEEQWVESICGLLIPTRDEMKEIEFSSRLYEENSALFMTAQVILKSDSSEPKSDAITFIITQSQLITLRYVEPHSFLLFTSKITKLKNPHHTPDSLLIEYLETVVDRLSDILEKVGFSLDEHSQLLFRSAPEYKVNYQQLLKKAGAHGDLNTKARESLISFERLIIFFSQHDANNLNEKLHSQIEVMLKDIHSLSEYSNFISNKISFLLSAALGFVNIEQNDIIKIFSVVSVVFLPPTLIASLYGMNFHRMPELSWSFGYPIAILAMLTSALLPYAYFKRRRWL